MEKLNNRNACYYLLIEHFLAGAFESEYYKEKGLPTSGWSIAEGWGRSLKQAKKNAKTVYHGNCDLSCIMDETKVIVNGKTVKDTTFLNWHKKTKK